jgi:hypothetical protein
MNGLLDILQGASNAAASNVSGPVDGLAWLLRKAGIQVDNPVGGSDWMAQKGLTAQPRNANMGLLGEALGMSAPIAAAAKAPQIARGLLKVGENAAAPRAMNPQKGAIVYHGSPHKFDAFDSSKIGTGEGAQAYGHGMYFAESPGVAKSYQKALSADRGFNFGGKSELTREQVQDAVNAQLGGKYLDGVTLPSGVADALMDDIVLGMSRTPGHMPRQYKPGSERAELYRQLQEQITQSHQGNLYKVDLPDEQIAKMLDWDKPLSQQPQAAEALERAGVFTGRKTMGPVGEQWEALIGPGGVYVNPNDPAQRAYIAAQQALGAGSASETFRKAGIPGIRYLDGGSRGAGSGTSNYVVFPGEEGLLKILGRE